MKRIVTIFMTLTILTIFLTSCTSKCNPANANEDKRPVLDKIKGKALYLDLNGGSMHVYYTDEFLFIGEAPIGGNPTTGNIKPPNTYTGHPNAAKTILDNSFSIKASESKTFTLPIYALNTPVAPDGIFKFISTTNNKIVIEAFTHEIPNSGGIYDTNDHERYRFGLTSGNTSDVEVEIEIYDNASKSYKPGPVPKAILKPAKSF